MIEWCADEGTRTPTASLLLPCERVREINGHDLSQIVEALDALPFHAQKPSALIAHTVKGKGVSFAEDTYVWHSNTVNDEVFARALAELEVP